MGGYDHDSSKCTEQSHRHAERCLSQRLSGFAVLAACVALWGCEMSAISPSLCLITVDLRLSGLAHNYDCVDPRTGRACVLTGERQLQLTFTASAGKDENGTYLRTQWQDKRGRPLLMVTQYDRAMEIVAVVKLWRRDEYRQAAYVSVTGTRGLILASGNEASDPLRVQVPAAGVSEIVLYSRNGP